MRVAVPASLPGPAPELPERSSALEPRGLVPGLPELVPGLPELLQVPGRRPGPVPGVPPALEPTLVSGWPSAPSHRGWSDPCRWRTDARRHPSRPDNTVDD